MRARALLALCLLWSGCSPEPPDNLPHNAASAVRDEPPLAPVGYQGGPVENGGEIAGRVRVLGAIPPPRKLRVTQDAQACGRTEIDSEELTTDAGGGLRWAVVYLDQIARGKPLARLGTAAIENRGCRFVPHVALAAVNAPVAFLNGDAVGHTMDAYPRKNTLGVLLGAGKSDARSFEFAERMRIECQIHKWMSCFLWVCEHPYYTVTGADGSFSLTDVPAGTYTLCAWAEHFEDEWTRAVTVPAGGKTSVEVTFEIR